MYDSVMDLADITFKPSLRIKRILESIFFTTKLNSVDDLTPSVLVEAFIPGEDVSLKENQNTGALIKYLDENDIASCNIGSGLLDLNDTKDSAWVITQLDIKVKNLDQLRYLFSEVKKHYNESDIVFFNPTGELQLNDNRIRFKVDSPGYRLLKLIFIEADSRDQVFSYADDYLIGVKHLVYEPTRRSVAAFCRDTGNYVNKRVEDKTGVAKFLVVTTKSIQLNTRYFV